MIGKALCLLSGGLDSSVALQLAKELGWEVAAALTFDYGQRAAAREAEQASQIASFFHVSHRLIALPWFREFSRGGSLLSTVQNLPQPNVAQLSDAQFTKGSSRAVWVPNRNGVLIEIAAAIAEDSGFDAVIVGFNREEAATFPDNSIEYMNAINTALAYSTSNGVKVISPTAPFSKPEIVERAAKHQFPFELLWSCYECRHTMCGRCESCMRLKRALHQNALPLEAYFENAPL